MLPKEFDESNFGRIQIKDRKGEACPAYLLTRDAFTLLAMGMTGKTAIMWKLRYIAAFNALEQAALENRAELAREVGYLQGHDEALALSIMESERKRAFLAGLTEGKKLARKEDRHLALEKIVRYMAKGLSYSEIGKILGLSRNCVAKRVERARKTGFWPQKSGSLTQLNLPGVVL